MSFVIIDVDPILVKIPRCDANYLKSEWIPNYVNELYHPREAWLKVVPGETVVVIGAIRTWRRSIDFVVEHTLLIRNGQLVLFPYKSLDRLLNG